MVQRSTVIQLLAVLAHISLTSCMRRGKTNEATDFKDVLIVSMQDSITTLTDLLAQQTQKLNEANMEIEQLKMKLSNFESTPTGLIEDLRTEFSQQTSKYTQQIEDLTQQIETQNTTFSQKIEDLTTEFAEDKEAVITSVSTQIDGLATKSTKEKETLTSGFSQQIEALKDKLAGSENNTTTKLDQLREEAARAEEDMKYNVSVVTTKLGELKHEVTRAQNSTTEKIEEITTNLTMVTSGVEDLVSKVSAVEDVAGTWPTGAYCILGSGGSCPTGFTRHSGYVKYIYTYNTGSSYLRTATFGDSYVGCYHGYSSSCSANGNWKASIAITACCK